KSFELTKVIHLLEDPLTANLKEKHLFTLKNLLKKSQIGFILKELTGIAKILNICAEKVKDHHEYLPILCEALKICSLPFLKEKSSDELNYAKDATDFLSHMGNILMKIILKKNKSEFCVCVSVKHLEGLQVTSPGYRLQLLERSDLAQTLLLSMAALENQPQIKLKLLQTLQFLSSSSDKNCALMLSARGAETMCLHMNEDDPTRQMLLRTSDILWNLLERGCREDVTAQLNSMECILSLKEAFLRSFEYSDRQVTNVLLMIITVIAETLTSLLIVDCSRFNENQIVCIYASVKNPNPSVCDIQINYSQEDLKMKKLLLNLLIIMSNDMAAVQIYREERVILALLTLMKPPGALSEWQTVARDWSVSQQEALQLQALTALAAIAPLLLDNYASCQGNTCLLLLLDWCVKQDAEFERGNNVRSAERGVKKVQVLYCIRVLRSVTASGDETVNQDLCDQGLINQLLGILTQMEANSNDKDIVTIQIMTDIQLILAVLCESDMHRKELFGSEGVEMVIHFLKKGSHKFYSGLGHNKLTLTTIDCVWSCIVGCYTTEDYFLAKGGVCLLLDMLSVSSALIF
uniref:Cilia- and flagella-associated protein 69 ARM repeats domain-containing protein n=1 Tax=Tetraodon nigroviridis TaxID=99883 RepID=H3CJK6_TETNG